jgi:hypothetical protein
MAGGGNRRSREAIVAARERERNVVQLYIRGLTWFEIARQLQLTGESGARAAFNRAIKRIPKGDVELLRKLEGERITDLRRRIWSELAGRADAEGNTVRPEPELVVDLVDRAIKLGRHEALIFGYDAPTKQVVSHFGSQPISDEELDAGLARLTEEEQEQFMMLLQKLQGRWVEPPPPASIETTASPVAAAGEIEVAKGNGNSNG